MLPLSRVTVRCAVGYMLETPSIRWYSPVNVSPDFWGEAMGSQNPSGADNQQETASAGSSETARQARRSNAMTDP